MNQKTFVTKTFMPPKEEYEALLDDLWKTGWVTNNGKYLLDLESKLAKFFNAKYVVFVNNGTIALQIAYKALDLKGDVITTPFSYVATSSSLKWEGCNPVFVDINKNTFCIDANLIESSITPETTAIVATHVYGNTCDVEKIEAIAKKHELKVIYDAAHSFGVNKKDGKSLFQYGDMSTLSFHATKIFHTIEGGCIVTNNDEIVHKLRYLRNFGHNGEEEFWGIGVNGKASEFNAAMGICNFKYVKEILSTRKKQWKRYQNALISFKLLEVHPEFEFNCAYFPIVFESEDDLLMVRERLNEINVFPKRYFYPSLEKLPYVKQMKVPVTDSISKRTLCLPLFHDLENHRIDEICAVINNLKS